MNAWMIEASYGGDFELVMERREMEPQVISSQLIQKQDSALSPLTWNDFISLTNITEIF